MTPPLKASVFVGASLDGFIVPSPGFNRMQIPAKCDTVSPTMFKDLRQVKPAMCAREIRIVQRVAARPLMLAAAITLASPFFLLISAHQAAPSKPAVVQPGAPGKPTRALPSTTRATLPPA